MKLQIIDISDKMTDNEMAKAEEMLTEIRGQQLSPVSLSLANKIEREILDELTTLRQKVADMETAKVFSVQIFDNLVGRLNDVENKVRIIERTYL